MTGPKLDGLLPEPEPAPPTKATLFPFVTVNGAVVHTLAVAVMVGAPTKLVGQTNVRFPVASWQILKVT